jgi:hypothetical protein
MAGLKKINIYEYNIDGSFHCKYDSLAEYSKKHYDNSKYPTFRNKKIEGFEYNIIKDLVSFKNERPGRKRVQLIVKMHNSELINDVCNKAIEMVNLRNEVIAEFKSVIILTKLMPNISQSTIHHHLNDKKKGSGVGKVDYRFRYK